MKRSTPVKKGSKPTRKSASGKETLKAPRSASSQNTNAKAHSPLLENCRTKWQHGAWEELVQINEQTISHDPERAKLALLLSVAHHHTGSADLARFFAKKAIGWGADRRSVACILLSAAYNDLGRFFLYVGETEEATSNFSTAIRLVEPQADIQLQARTRQLRELAAAGLLSNAVEVFGAELTQLRAEPDEIFGRLEHLEREFATLSHFVTQQTPLITQDSPKIENSEKQRGGARLMTGTQPKAALDFQINTRYSSEAYKNLSEQNSLILFEIKSLPRAGLHYVEGALASVMREEMSFCEWYQEPGCCRRMPCELTKHLSSQVVDEKIRLRVVKSHDFDLADPRSPPMAQLQRLILVRDPIYLLTSWWNLDLLARNTPQLKKAGIDPTYLFYRHDKAVLDAAYRALDDVDLECGDAQVADWIQRRKPYMLGFVEKWVADTKSHASSYQNVIRYEEVPDFLIFLFNTISDRLTQAQQARFKLYIDARKHSFKPRTDPFYGPTNRITAALLSARDVFEVAARDLKGADSTGVLTWASNNGQ